MIERGIIKWKPFDSLYSANETLKEINQNKEKINCPTLSDDQLINLEEKIKNSYILKEKIDLNYFYNGKILTIQGIIEDIDTNKKKIIINHKNIFFIQIISIN